MGIEGGLGFPVLEEVDPSPVFKIQGKRVGPAARLPARRRHHLLRGQNRGLTLRGVDHDASGDHQHGPSSFLLLCHFSTLRRGRDAPKGLRLPGTPFFMTRRRGSCIPCAIHRRGLGVKDLAGRRCGSSINCARRMDGSSRGCFRRPTERLPSSGGSFSFYADCCPHSLPWPWVGWWAPSSMAAHWRCLSPWSPSCSSCSKCFRRFTRRWGRTSAAGRPRGSMTSSPKPVSNRQAWGTLKTPG